MSRRIHVLGDVGATDEHGDAVPLGGARPRCLLAALVLRQPEFASADWLAEAVWPDEASRPDRPTDTIRTYIARIRRQLGESLIETGSGAYRLRIDSSNLDSATFEELLARSHASGLVEDERRRLLSAALELWRGDTAFGDFGDRPPFDIEQKRLDELRIVARENLLASGLRSGHHRALVADIGALAAAHPLREEPVRLLMTALYRTGSQAEALRAFQRYRSLLVDELGLEPSPRLIDLERKVAVGDDGLHRGLPEIRLEGYDLGQRLGSDRHGTFFDAVQTGLDRRVEIYAIDARTADEADFIRAFETEAQLLARLHHPAIVPLIDYWRGPGGAYLVSAHPGGQTLADHLQDGPQSLNAVIEWLVPIGRALGAVHRGGLVHGNVGSDSIQFDIDGSPFLGRFGLSVLHRGGRARSDVSALAAVVVEALDPTEVARGPLASVIEATINQGDDDAADVESFVDSIVAARDGFGRAQPASPHPPTTTVPLNVYQGLRAFDEADASRFFGRDTEVQLILDSLADTGFVAVVGPSGCGKSSIVRAGVIPRLREDTDWFIVSMTPGADPFAELGAALLRVMVDASPSLVDDLASAEDGLGSVIGRHLVDDGSEVVVVIDQFEELYTLTADRARRDRFLDVLVASVTAADRPIRLLCTIRADFFDRPLRHPELGRLFTRHQHAVLPMSPENLERAVAGPAESVGVSVEPALLAALIAEIDDSEAPLPLLQYSLFELFERRSGDVLTMDIYRAIGGLSGAISIRADEVYQGLTGEGRRAAARLLPELVTLGEGTEDTRRRVERTDFPAGADVDEVLDEFGRARLLTFDRNPLNRRPTLEIAHEALIREWPRLRSWVDENREALRIARQVDRSALEWEQGGRDPSDLYRGGRLTLALEHVGLEGGGWTTRARDFVEAARIREAEERAAAERAHRRLRALAVAIGAVAVIAALATVVALVARRDATRQATEATTARAVAENRRLIADAAQLVDSNRRVALLLAAEAYRRDPSPAALGGLQSVIAGTPGFESYVHSGHSHSRVEWLDAEHLVAVADGEMVLLHSESGEVLADMRVGDVTALTIDEDATMIAVASGRQIRVVGGDSARWLTPVTGPLSMPSQVQSLAFSGGEHLVAGHRDGSVAILRLPDGEIVERFTAHPEQSMTEFDVEGDIEPGVPHQPETFGLGVSHLAVSPAEDLIVTGSLAVVRMWTGDGTPLAEGISTRTDVDGTRALAGIRDLHIADDGTVLVASAFAVGVHDSVTGDKLSEQPINDPRHLTTATPGIDSTVGLHAGGIVVGGDGGVVALFPLADRPGTDMDMDMGSDVDIGLDVAPTMLDSQLPGHPDVALSPDRHQIAFAADDGIAVLNVDGSNFASVVVETGDAEEVTITADGSLMAVSRADSTPSRFYRLARGRATPLQPTAAPPTFAWAGLGRHVYGWREGADTGLSAFDNDLRHQYTFEHTGTASTIAVTDDQRLVAVAEAAVFDEPAGILVFDNNTGAFIVELDDLAKLSPEPALVRSIGFSHDGRFLVAADDFGAAVVWETSTWAPVDPVLSGGGGGVMQAKYSPDDTWLVTVDQGGVVTLRDPMTFQPARRLPGNTDGVSGLSHGPTFTDDGRYMITTADGLGRIWDLEANTQIGGVFRSDTGLVPNGSVGGRFLATMARGRATVWDLRFERWFDMICHAAGRNMTVEEWERFGPEGEPYHTTCDEWPDPTAVAAAPNAD